ncbi:mRNA degradation protein, partial [Smittium culicis]
MISIRRFATEAQKSVANLKNGIKSQINIVGSLKCSDNKNNSVGNLKINDTIEVPKDGNIVANVKFKKSKKKFEKISSIKVNDSVTPSLGVWRAIKPMKYTLASINNDAHEKVPKLAHGLDEILFKSGYHFLKNPKNGSYNYPPFLKSITQPEDFDYSKLTPFIKPSDDLKLQKHATNLKKRYVGSTSSMTGAMSQLYFLISNFKNADTLKFSSAFASEGKSMEKMLVSEQNDYEKFIKASLVEPNDNTEESYIYSTFNDFLLRSQLDCKDQRLKKVTFDLKTRAVVAVRMDVENYKETRGYQITKDVGLLQSFEREYYDLVRSAFLKYNFQTRIGHMDGVFVAYHNTASICGFQYISTKEMDRRLYGNSLTGNYSFNSTLILLNEILNT